MSVTDLCLFPELVCFGSGLVRVPSGSGNSHAECLSRSVFDSEWEPTTELLNFIGTSIALYVSIGRANYFDDCSKTAVVMQVAFFQIYHVRFMSMQRAGVFWLSS